MRTKRAFKMKLAFFIIFEWLSLKQIIFFLEGESPTLNQIFSFWFVTELFCVEVLETLVILLAILLPIKWPVASTGLWIALSEAVLSAV